MAEEWRRDGYLVSTDPSKLDLDVVHRWLSESSYWVPGIPFDVVRRGVEGSLNFGLYAEGGARTIGLARIITDFATFAYVCDVFVLEEFRGQGPGRLADGVRRRASAHAGPPPLDAGYEGRAHAVREDRLRARRQPRPLDGEGRPGHLPPSAGRVAQPGQRAHFAGRL